MAAYPVGITPPLWVNRKSDTTNPRKGSTTIVGELRPKLFVMLARMQVNQFHSPSSEVLAPLEREGPTKELVFHFEIFI